MLTKSPTICTKTVPGTYSEDNYGESLLMVVFDVKKETYLLLKNGLTTRGHLLMQNIE
jgi:hypothetical protein